MGQLGNMIKMLILLKSRGKMKASELAEEIEVGERMIRRYKDEFEQAGIYIGSMRGQYGGYYLEDENFIFNLNLSTGEFAALHMANEHLNSTGFIFMKEYRDALDKINATLTGRSSISRDKYLIDIGKPNMDIDVEKKKYTDLNAAFITRNKVKIKYFSLTGEGSISERIVQPYVFFMYKGFWYMAAYCENRRRVLDFKLSRIMDYKILDDKYDISEDFDLNGYMEANSMGIFNQKEYDVKLRIEHPMATLVKETVIVENQNIIYNEEDNSIIFEATMRGLPEIISWILSMGDRVTVLEPEELRLEVEKEVIKLKEKYKI